MANSKVRLNLLIARSSRSKIKVSGSNIMANSKVSLKLLIDRSSHKVLFAEAGKEFVDFLFYLLALPIGTVIRLLTKKCMVGCLGNLYDSVENLSQIYIQPNKDKDSLLKSEPTWLTQVPLLLTNESQTPISSEKKYYICLGCSRYISDDTTTICPSCRQHMNFEVIYIATPTVNTSSSDEGGFVKGVVTYMVMDDLEVKPMSTISCITLINKFNVSDMGALEEKVVDMTMAEVCHSTISSVVIL